MNHDARAADALRSIRHDPKNPGRTLLALERLGLFIGDTALAAINEDDRVTAHHVIDEVPTASLGPLGRVVVRSDSHQAIREAYEATRAAQWIRDIEQAKGAA